MKLLLCLSILVHLTVSFTTPVQDATTGQENPVPEDLNEHGNTLDHPGTTPGGTTTTEEQEKPSGETVDSEARSRESGNSHDFTETWRMAQATTSAVNDSEETTATDKDVASVKHSAMMRDTVKQDMSSREDDVLSDVGISNKSAHVLKPDKVDPGSAERRDTRKAVPAGRSVTNREPVGLNSEGSKVADCQDTSCVSTDPSAAVKGLHVAVNASGEGKDRQGHEGPEREAVPGDSRRLGVNAMVKPAREPQDLDSLEMAHGRILQEGYSRDDLDETLELISAERIPAALDQIVRRPGQ
ncbi:uncharacterized protein LOC124477666 isoform X2 [Hypomesus transpacificus]|uniref:uncharacterized protein LOC124477666 isoform X2 n=1 Tax=Hypomesus transpacificus TaxID=137520 RepID=UPI001F07D393|nr:uncharacterized protein LOC124477666 isoform X2 [Hypomesus transpacificus]